MANSAHKGQNMSTDNKYGFNSFQAGGSVGINRRLNSTGGTSTSTKHSVYGPSSIPFVCGVGPSNPSINSMGAYDELGNTKVV